MSSILSQVHCLVPLLISCCLILLYGLPAWISIACLTLRLQAALWLVTQQRCPFLRTACMVRCSSMLYCLAVIFSSINTLCRSRCWRRLNTYKPNCDATYVSGIVVYGSQ